MSGFSLLYTSDTLSKLWQLKMFPDIASCLIEAKSRPVEKQCFLRYCRSLAPSSLLFGENPARNLND